MKRIFTLFILAAVLFSLFFVTVYAQEETGEALTNVPREPGMCGESISWSFDPESGILTVSGNGAMDDFPEGAPWLEYQEDILEVHFRGNIDYVGAHAFEDCDALTLVYFGTSIRELGTRAFYSCDGLTSLELPSTFRVFGEESLRNCTFLKEIHCQGGMPSFRMNCLWDTWTKIYYPVDNPWPLEHIEQLEGAFQGRIEFLAEDGFDPYVPEEPETEPPTTEPPTTEPPTTEPPTEPPTTEPPTEPPTTEAPTESAVTEAPTETAPTETEPPVSWGTQPPTEPPEAESSGSWVGAGIIGMVLSLIALGAVIFGGRRGKGRYRR